MINKYYQRELAHLHELAQDFAKAHPALAPMLSGQASDPDVERLLEGSAFLSGLVNERLDNEFPEVVHGLMQLVFPHYLRPLPSATIIRFTPKAGLMETLSIPKGTAIASTPIEGVSCRFTTCSDVTLHPLAITSLSFQRPSSSRAVLRLDFSLRGILLEKWDIDRLRFHLSGEYASASNLFALLLTQTESITLADANGNATSLSPGSIVPAGFTHEEALLPYPRQSFPGYRYLQEYFIMPEKFLFFELADLERWKNKSGSTFSISIELKNVPPDFPQPGKRDISLYSTPAINLFHHDAEPVILDHKRPEYQVRPSGGFPNGYQVYSVEKVVGFQQGSVRQREYQHFQMFNPQVDAVPVFSVHHRPSAVSDREELYISVAYPPTLNDPTVETLSMDLLCTNASLPEELQYGDVGKPTESSPELAIFENIKPPTAPIQPPLGKNLLWRLLSHLYLNYLPAADTESLRSLVKLYIFTDTRDRARVLANTKRVESIAGLTVTPSDRIVRGLPLRGQDILLKLDPSGFASNGDLHLFGAVLNQFLSGYASINCYTRLTVENLHNKEQFSWPAQLGNRPLL